MKLLYHFIYYSAIAIWIFPPLRQIKSKYFYFFLFLILSEIFAYIFHKLFITNTIVIYSVFSYLLVISLFNSNTVKKNIYYLIAALIILVLSSSYIKPLNDIYLIFFQALMFVIILKNIILHFISNRIINVFQLVLAFYVLTLITKFLNLFTGTADAYTYFIITSTFEILFGLFFSIFKADNSRLVLQFK